MAELASWRLDTVLKTEPGVRLHKAQGPRGSRIIQEIYAPAEVRQPLLDAVAAWRRVELPQAIPVEEVGQSGSSLFLVNPEMRVGAAAGGDWVAQLAELVARLVELKFPHPFEVLHEDYVHFDLQGNLQVWNPGWAAVRHQARTVPTAEGLQRFARLVEALSAAPPSVSLMWILGRCQHRGQGLGYSSFAELRQALQHRQVVREQAADPVPEAPAPAPPRLRLWAGFVALASALLCLGMGMARPTGPARPGTAFAREHTLVWQAAEGGGRQTWKLPATIQTMASNGQRLCVSYQGQAGVDLYELNQKIPLHVPLADSPEALEVTPDGRAVLAVGGDGRVTRIDLATGQKTESVVGPEGLSGAVQLDGEPDLVLLHPTTGLALYPASSRRPTQRQPVSGLDSLVSCGPYLWSACPQRHQLLRFDRQLQEQAAFPLPGGSGPTRLFVNTYGGQLWSVQSGGLIGLWQLPEATMVRHLQLPVPPACVCPDSSGHLWILGQDGRLLCLDARTWELSERATGLESAEAMAYLGPVAGAR